MAKNSAVKLAAKKSSVRPGKSAHKSAALTVVKKGRLRSQAEVRGKIAKNIKKNAEGARLKKWMEKNLPPPGTPEWEALCNHCGKCCYDKTWSGNQLLLLASPCSFLDTEAQRCTCYDERFEKEPLCLPIDYEIVLMGGLPGDCPYVEGLPGYKGPIPVDKTIDEC